MRNLFITLILGALAFPVFAEKNASNYLTEEQVEAITNDARSDKNVCSSEAEFRLMNSYKVLEKIFSEYQAKADAGDVRATYILALFYDHGFDGSRLERNKNKALEYLTLAARKNLDDAMLKLAMGYENPDGFSSPEKAFYWYSQLAAKGNSVAQFKLSQFYGTGFGTEQNFERSFFWCEKSAENGNADAMLQLSYMYERAVGTLKNLNRAYVYSKKASLAGNEKAVVRVKEFENLKLDLIANWEQYKKVPGMKSLAESKMREGRGLMNAKSSDNGFATRGGYGLNASTDNSAANRRGEMLMEEAQRILAQTDRIKAMYDASLEQVLEVFDSVVLTFKGNRRRFHGVVLSCENEQAIVLNRELRKIAKFYISVLDHESASAVRVFDKSYSK